jgi:hypothetical protein
MTAPKARTTSRKIHHAIFSGARSNRPASVDRLPWDELADTIKENVNRLTTAPKTADIEEQKKCMIALLPARLKKGATRSSANVEAVGMLALDVDDGTDPERIAARLRKAGHAALIYETARSTKDAPRVRVLAPTTRDMTPDECGEMRIRFAEAIGLGVESGVAACLNPDRIFFLGKAHGSPKRRVWRLPGRAVDPDALPPTKLAWGAAKAPAVAMAPLAKLPPADKGIVAALGDWREHQGRKWQICGALGGLLRRQAFSRHQCEAVVREWLPADGAPDKQGRPTVDVEHGLKWALGAWAKDAGEVSGAETLAGIVGEDHARIVESAVAQASPFAGTRRALKKIIERRTRAKLVADASDASADPLGTRLLQSETRPPLEYYCEGLRLAPSRGKISLIAGMPGAGKGPIADHLAVCFALGLKAFERWPCRKSRVTLLDCEGAELTAERLSRMTRSMGREPTELDKRLATCREA